MRDQTGDWYAAGQTRNIALVGGGGMRETLTSVDPPHSFGYTLTDVRGPMSPLIDQSRASGTSADGTGTKVTWQWTLAPEVGLTAPVLPVFGKMWKGYARQALETLSKQLVH